MPFRLAVTQLEHAEWLAGKQESAVSAPLLADAKDTFQRLRAVPWLERLNHLEPARDPVLAPGS